MLTGRVPFDAKNLVDIILRIRGEEPIAPRFHRPEIVERVVRRALTKGRDERFASADAMREDLADAYLESHPSMGAGPGPSQRELESADTLVDRET